jgi:hypothetical protein
MSQQKGEPMNRPASTVEIRGIEDLEHVCASVDLPVGPRTGPRKRTKEKKEWYVILRFLETTIPLGMFKLPMTVRNGIARNNEPDFVVSSNGLTVALFEVTEATDKTDQRERTAFERSGKNVALLGAFGGRFAKGASRPGIVWATDVIDAIRRKSGKVIFQGALASRHLLIYPNSNASFLLFDENDESEAVEYLRAEVAKDATELARTTNGCLVHILGKHMVCLDALNARTILALGRSVT